MRERAIAFWRCRTTAEAHGVARLSVFDHLLSALVEFVEHQDM